MKQVFLNGKQGSTLKLFFAGYGQDPTPFIPLCSESQASVAMVYDYEDMSFNEKEYQDFEKIELISWSIGVMVSAYILKSSSLLPNLTSRIAINGTPDGIAFSSLAIGLPCDLWYQTYEHMDEHGQESFFKAMLGAKADYYLSHLPKRQGASYKAELLALYEFRKNQSAHFDFDFDKAYIGTKDKIFPPLILRKAFDNGKTTVIKGPWAHFDQELFSKIFSN